MSSVDGSGASTFDVRRPGRLALLWAHARRAERHVRELPAALAAWHRMRAVIPITPARRRSRVRLAGEVLRTAVVVRRRLRASEDVRQILGDLRDGVLAAPRPSSPAEDPLRLAVATRRTLGLIPGDSRCLVQSLTLSAMLSRRGQASVLVLGTRPPSNAGLAHAWVEDTSGRPLLPVHGFVRLAEL
jgi:hypothetical protein